MLFLIPSQLSYLCRELYCFVFYFLILEKICYDYYMIYYRILNNSIRYSTLSTVSGCSFILVILGKQMGPVFLFAPAEDDLILLILLTTISQALFPSSGLCSAVDT